MSFRSALFVKMLGMINILVENKFIKIDFEANWLQKWNKNFTLVAVKNVFEL